MSKQKLVAQVFNDVAAHYDLMNDLMSFGIHRLWKKKLISQIYYRKEKSLLDVAGGTGDIASLFIQQGGGVAVMSDINQNMLKEGLCKMIDKYGLSFLEKIKFVCADAHRMPFKDNTFDYLAISFGIRNVSDIILALQEMKRVLKPGGKLLCLEFMNPSNQYNYFIKFYNMYSSYVIPKLGKLVANSYDSYLYLIESIRNFPMHQEFIDMINSVGFTKTSFIKLILGIAGIYICYKPLV